MDHKKSEPRVVISRNGPYIVVGGVPLSTQTIAADAGGDSEAWKESALFRRRRNTRYADAGSRRRSHSATARTPRSASTAARRRTVRLMSIRRRVSTGLS